MRWPIVGTVALAGSILLAGQALAAASWAPPGGASTAVIHSDTCCAWDNGDPALTETANGDLHAVFISDYLPDAGGKFAFEDLGRFLGSYYVTSTDGGASWSTSKRLNPSTQHGERATLASSGNNLYVAYMSQKHYYKKGFTYTFDTSEPRVVYFVRSTDGGATWKPRVKLPSQSLAYRGDYIYIAAAGTYVYVTTTNVNNGNIDLWISPDNGVNWTHKKLGVSTFVDGATADQGGYVGGFSGLPAVAAVGSYVGVAWVGNPAGKVQAKISSDHGVTWAAQTLATAGGADNLGYVEAAGHDTRLAFTWTTAGGGFVRVYDTSVPGWQTRKKFVSFPDAALAGVACNSDTTDCNQGGEGAMVALKGTSTIGIALSECNMMADGHICDWNEGFITADPSDDREMLVWRDSANNGTSWSAPSIIQKPVTTPQSEKLGTKINDFGSVMYRSNGTPYALWNAHDNIYYHYTVRVKSCAGCA